MNKTFLSITALAAALIAFVAVNVVSQRTLRSARADLTQNRLFTLSDGARNIARNLKEPIRLTLYYSEQAGNDAAVIKPYAARVKELLGEFASSSGGKIDFRIVNPEPFSDAEDEAVAAGLAGFPTGRGSDRLYFGLVGKNSTDRQEVIPFFEPQKEEFLEYDVTRLIHLLSDVAKKPVGLMSWLPLSGEQQANPFGERGQPPMQIYRQLSDLFDVKNVPTNATEIPKEIGVLMVVHPKKMAARTQFAIDQFVLRGGRLLLFVDPLCSMDTPPGVNPMQAMNLPKDSELNKLLAAWGAEMAPAKIAADRELAIKVNAGAQNRPEPVDHVGFIANTAKYRSQTDPLTGTIQLGINLGLAGVLSKKDGATTEFAPLITTSTNATAIDAATFAFMPDIKKLLAEFTSGGKSLTLAARITGKVKTAFPEGLPPLEAGQNEAEQPKPPATPALTESADAANIVVIADCDMLADQFWMEPDRQLGPIVVQGHAFADNGTLVFSALDNLSGSNDLASLRARGRSARPFDTVQQIQKDAEQKYHSKEAELRKKLQDTEQKIADLQRQKGDGQQAVVALSPEQRQEIARFREQMVTTRKELRDVQHQLRKDIEGLGTRVKAINIGLMPVLVGLGAVSLAAYRAGRRRAERKSLGATD